MSRQKRIELNEEAVLRVLPPGLKHWGRVMTRTYNQMHDLKLKHKILVNNQDGSDLAALCLCQNFSVSEDTFEFAVDQAPMEFALDSGTTRYRYFVLMHEMIERDPRNVVAFGQVIDIWRSRQRKLKQDPVELFRQFWDTSRVKPIYLRMLYDLDEMQANGRTPGFKYYLEFFESYEDEEHEAPKRGQK